MRCRWKGVLFVLLIAALVLLAGCSIFSGGAQIVLDQALLALPDIVLVSYSSAITGTDGGDCSETLVLLTTGDADRLRLDWIYLAVGEEQTSISYDVPTKAAEDCLAYIDEAGLKAWLKLKNPIAWSGMAKSCSFRDGDQYVTVSTDAMPEDGSKVLSHIGQILKGYAAEASKNAEGED